MVDDAKVAGDRTAAGSAVMNRGFGCMNSTAAGMDCAEHWPKPARMIQRIGMTLPGAAAPLREQVCGWLMTAA
jgi:hypothetical protein